MTPMNRVSTLFFSLIGAIIGLLFGLGYSHQVLETNPDLITVLTLFSVIFGIRFGQLLQRIAVFLWKNIKPEK